MKEKGMGVKLSRLQNCLDLKLLGVMGKTYKVCTKVDGKDKLMVPKFDHL
jgi:hypothetical protein